MKQDELPGKKKKCRRDPRCAPEIALLFLTSVSRVQPAPNLSFCPPRQSSLLHPLLENRNKAGSEMLLAEEDERKEGGVGAIWFFK